MVKLKKTLVIHYKDEKFGKPIKNPEIITLSEEIMNVDMEKWQYLADTSENAIMFNTPEEAGVWRYALEFRKQWADKIDKFGESMIIQHNIAALKYPEYFV